MHEFDNILKTATSSVPEMYFQLPVDGQENPIYRERVYCYELYHQMRVVWPEYSPYTLGGEVDKSGHRLIRGNGLDNTKPDFLVHVPGNMDGNFAIIEVKPIRASRNDIKKDIGTLSSFLNHANYARAIYLFYGRDIDGNGIDVAQEEMAMNQIEQIEIWYHSTHDQPAELIE